MFEVAKHLIDDAKELATELVKSDQQSIPIRITGFYVTVNPENKTVIHRFECENIFCYITMGE